MKKEEILWMRVVANRLIERNATTHTSIHKKVINGQALATIFPDGLLECYISFEMNVQAEDRCKKLKTKRP